MDKNNNKIYRISILPMAICFCIMWIGIIVIFLILKEIKYNEISEMAIVGFISFIVATVFIKFITKVVVSAEGIMGSSNDNKSYFVQWDKIERIKLKRFINLKFIVIYFNIHTQSIYIPLFLSRKKEFIDYIIHTVPSNNILRQYFENGIEPHINPHWSSSIDKEMLLKQKEQIKNIFQGSVAIFYIITFSSVINTFINIYRNKNEIYIIGLGATKVINNFTNMFSGKLNYFYVYEIGIVIDISLAWLFIFLGHYANKRLRWSFVTGVILYGLDCLLLLSLKDYVAAIFHGFLLICLTLGIEYGSLLTEIENQLEGL